MKTKFLQYILNNINSDMEICVEVNGKIFTINHVRECDNKNVIVLKEN